MHMWMYKHIYSAALVSKKVCKYMIYIAPTSGQNQRTHVAGGRKSNVKMGS